MDAIETDTFRRSKKGKLRDPCKSFGEIHGVGIQSASLDRAGNCDSGFDFFSPLGDGMGLFSLKIGNISLDSDDGRLRAYARAHARNMCNMLTRVLTQAYAQKGNTLRGPSDIGAPSLNWSLEVLPSAQLLRRESVFGPANWP